LGRAAQFQQNLARRTGRRDGLQQAVNAAQDDGQFLIPIVRRCCRYRARSIDSGYPFHDRMVLVLLAEIRHRIELALQKQRDGRNGTVVTGRFATFKRRGASHSTIDQLELVTP